MRITFAVGIDQLEHKADLFKNMEGAMKHPPEEFAVVELIN